MNEGHGKRRKKGWSRLPTDMQRWLPDRASRHSPEPTFVNPSSISGRDPTISLSSQCPALNDGADGVGSLSVESGRDPQRESEPGCTLDMESSERVHFQELSEDELHLPSDVPHDSLDRDAGPSSGIDRLGVVDVLGEDCGEQFAPNELQVGSNEKVAGAKVQIKNWSLLLGLLHATGSRRLTRESYDAMRRFCGAQIVYQGGIPAWNSNMVEDLPDGIGKLREEELSENAITKASPFPHERTVRRMIPELCQSLTARPVSLTLNVNLAKSGARPARGMNVSASALTPKTRVDVVLPSEWARLDVITDPVWREMTGEDVVPLISNRQNFYGNSIIAVPSGVPVSGTESRDFRFVGAGEVIAISTAEPGKEAALCADKFRREVLDAFDAEKLATLLKDKRGKRNSRKAALFPVDTDREAAQTQQEYAVVGQIVATWTVEGAASWETVNRKLLDREEHWRMRGEKADAGCESQENAPASGGRDDSADENLIEYLRMAHLSISEGRLGSKRQGNASQTRRSGSKRSAAEARERHERSNRPFVRPSVIPGDRVTLLRPAGTSQTKGRLLLVNRFWFTDGEARRQALWIPDLSSVRDKIISLATTRPDDCPFDAIFETPGAPVRNEGSLIAPTSRQGEDSIAIRNVYSVPWTPSDDDAAEQRRVVSEMPSQSHDSSQTPRNVPQRPGIAPAFGNLQTGERYFTYRIALYHDGFVYSQGRPASAEALYMVCLSLPRQRRRCRSAVRVLSLAPPGTDVAEIYDAVLEDILKGATEGFLAVTAEGTRVRVFLDLVAVVADTPAGNALLDVLGHTSNAPCHLCCFRRQTRLAGVSRYTATSISSRCLFAARHWKAHKAIRACEPRDDSLQALGMTSVASQRRLPLHKYAERLELRANMGEMPVDDRGQVIVPGWFDPYRAVVVAPDHLLCGIFRDSVNAAIALFPSLDQRRLFNTVLLSSLDEVGLSGVENELVNATQASLHSMTISSIYALAVVAAHALRMTVEMIGRDDGSRFSPSVPQKLRDCIQVVASASDLIYLFHVPERESVQGVFGGSFVSEFDVRARKHVANVASVCKSDANTDNGSRRQVSGHNRARRNGQGRACADESTWGDASPGDVGHDGLAAIARKSLDKPNLHRLLELAHVYLPAFGHGSFLSELMFESAHQAVKRSLERANKAWLPHVTALRHSVLNDFKGRLACLELPARKNDDNALRGCVRLLFGEEAVEPCTGRPVSKAMRSRVARALGPSILVSPHLQSEKNRILSTLPTHSLCNGGWIMALATRNMRDEPADTVDGATTAPSEACEAGDRVTQTGCGRALLSSRGAARWDENVKSIITHDREAVEASIQASIQTSCTGPSSSNSAICVCWLECQSPESPAAVWRILSAVDSMVPLRGKIPFTNRIRVGSIISCSCWDPPIGGSSKSRIEIHRPFVHLRESSRGADRASIIIWCVTGIFGERKESSGESAKRRNIHRDPSSSCVAQGLVVRPCQYVDTEDTVILHRDSWRAHQHDARNRAMKVSLSVGYDPFVIRLDSSEKTVEPVAVLHDCVFHKCSAFQRDGSLSARVLHPTRSSPLEGGHFYIREQLTGFPPRQA